MTGSQFEHMTITMLGNNGYWAHRIAPDARGAQPFDVIAVRNGHIIAADCKVCQSGRFSFTRYEENQRSSFRMFFVKNKDANNVSIGIFAWYNDDFYWIPYGMIESCSMKSSSIKLTEDLLCTHTLGLKY